MSISAERGTVGGASIALPIFVLVIASVLLATAVSFAVTFSGPPPFEPPRSIGSIARALKGQPPFPDFGGMPQRPPPGDRRGSHTDGPPGGDRMFGRDPRNSWRRTVEAVPPRARSGERPDAAARARLAATLGTRPDALVVLTEQGGRAEGDALFGSYQAAWHVGTRWYVVRSVEQPLFTRWHIRTMLAMLAAILILSGPAWLISGLLTRPLRRLAQAADQAGTGAPLPPLPGGSREVRHLARAVSTMHARLAGHAEGRTAMLAGIAHDLGTPLSRLAFRVEALSEEARARAAADIAEMRAMIRSTLAFARDDAGQQPAERLDLGSLLDTMADDLAATGTPVTLEAGPRAVVRGDPGALRRLFANLVDNAVRYGGAAALSWRLAGSSVEVLVDDPGTGIDPAMAERLFQPFVRGDPSRNRATGGTGLGLAIVRSIATAHGGAVTLQNREGGGARARVLLPLAV